MKGHIRARRVCFAAVAAAVLAVTLVGPSPALAAGVSYTVGPIRDVSASCSGQNAEVEQAVDVRLGYVYESWMGCKGIAFAWSANGGRSFSTPISVPGSVGSNFNVWDPAVAVAPDGTVYASFMRAKGSQWYPVVAASFDHGLSCRQVSSLVPPDRKSWGDRAFIAVGPDGTVYVTWDYGPERTSVTSICTRGGSCAFATGDLNVVVQKSTDHGKTWSPMSHISPGFPASGGDSAPLLVELTGGGPGTAYVGWLSDSNPAGYAQYLRTFSITGGWLSGPVQISKSFGDPAVWPGDTFGISTLTPGRVALSWGSATPATGKKSQIFAAAVGVDSSP